MALNVLLISVASARTGAIYSACGSTIPAGDLCQITADEYKSTMYEIGLCSSDAMASGTLDKTSCETIWANPTGLEVNPVALMSGSEVMDGTISRPRTEHMTICMRSLIQKCPTNSK